MAQMETQTGRPASSPAFAAAPPAAWWVKHAHWLILLFVGAFICIGITQGEHHFFIDEQRHAFTGVFFRDAYVDQPFDNPRRYALDYFAKYPALGLAHWPPLFHMVEGLAFLLFGISVLTSRLVIVAYALVGIYFWYRIAEKEGPRRRALLSMLIFPLVPYVLLYERVVMLEIPLLAMCLVTLYYWRTFLETSRSLHLWAVALLAAASLLTSQKAVFLVVFIVIHFLVERRFRLLLRWDLWLALLVTVPVVYFWYSFSFRAMALTVERVTGDSPRQSFQFLQYLIYPHLLPRQLGGLLTILGVAGFLWAMARVARKHAFLIVWVFATYLCFTLIQEKDLRHTMIWIPAFVYFALFAIEELCFRRRWALVASALLVAKVLWGAWNYDRPRFGGMEEVARYVLAQPESDVIYFQGPMNGNFIFFARALDPEKRRVIAREKQIVVTRINRSFGTRQVLTNPGEVLNFFRTWGIRYAVIENVEFGPDLSLMRQTLASGPFVVEREFPIWTNRTQWMGRKAVVYRFTGDLRRTQGDVSIPMMTLTNDIEFRLSQLAGKPWPPQK
jgi:hypothetical protein